MIYEILHFNSIGNYPSFSQEEQISKLEQKLNSLKNQVFDDVED